MTAKTITATFADGTVATRRTEADYVAASKDRTGRVRFHKAVPAARRDREVVAVDGAPVATTDCVICGGTGKVGDRSAVTGEVIWRACWGQKHAQVTA